MSWEQSAEARELLDKPEPSVRANPEQLARLLTARVRRDRFAEGSLAGDYESGLITRIVERTAVLLKQIDPNARPVGERP
jgi:uncharacterized protein DUF6508